MTVNKQIAKTVLASAVILGLSSAPSHAGMGAITGFLTTTCSAITDDPTARTECEDYVTTYVTDLTASQLSTLIGEEVAKAADTLDLMGLSDISNLADYVGGDLSDNFDLETLMAGDDAFSDSLTRIVNGRYDESFLSGLTEEETMDLYESEWDNLESLIDMTGLGGASASLGSIALDESSEELVTTVTETTMPISGCDPDFPSYPCVTGDADFGYSVIGATSGTLSQDFEGNWYLTTTDTVTDLVTSYFTTDYTPTYGTEVITSPVTRTITTSSESYDPRRETMNTLEIIAATMEASLSCMSWELKGICVWLKWTWSGPVIKTSIKAKNYVPEVTIQNYIDADNPPWTGIDMDAIWLASQGANDGLLTRLQTSLMGATGAYKDTGGGNNGSTQTKGKGNSRGNTKFRLVDVFGNPAATLWETTYGSLEAFCVPTTDMLEPYYISNLDAINWRQWFGVEFWNYKSWLVGTYMLGEYSDNNHYGSIYPRIGFTTIADDIKASVLTTYRAMHFITREGGLRVYQDIHKTGKGLWVENELSEDNPQSGKFQQLLPYKENSCRTFPLEKNPDGKRRGETGATMWNFWRKIECCKKRGSKLLFH